MLKEPGRHAKSSGSPGNAQRGGVLWSASASHDKYGYELPGVPDAWAFRSEK